MGYAAQWRNAASFAVARRWQLRGLQGHVGQTRPAGDRHLRRDPAISFQSLKGSCGLDLN